MEYTYFYVSYQKYHLNKKAEFVKTVYKLRITYLLVIIPNTE